MKNVPYPCFWFDNQAQEAAHFYISVFKEGKILSENAFVVEFEIMGRKYMAMNGGPKFTFTEATSMVITCKDQTEIDYYWNALLADGGEENKCGWLKDKYGLSWQIVPEQLGRLMSNPETAPAVGQALLTMVKLDIAALEKAAGK